MGEFWRTNQNALFSSRKKSKKKGVVPVVITITLQYSYKYMKVINRLTSDPPPGKKREHALPLAPA